MLPPKLIRRLVLAPLVAVIALAVALLFPLLAVLTWLFDRLTRSRPHRNRPLRLLFFALVWLFADTSAVFVCLALGSRAGSAAACAPSRTRSGTTRSCGGSST